MHVCVYICKFVDSLIVFCVHMHVFVYSVFFAVEVDQPPASTVRRFLALLEQSDIDFSEELGEIISVRHLSTCGEGYNVHVRVYWVDSLLRVQHNRQYFNSYS